MDANVWWCKTLSVTVTMSRNRPYHFMLSEIAEWLKSETLAFQIIPPFKFFDFDLNVNFLSLFHIFLATAEIKVNFVWCLKYVDNVSTNITAHQKVNNYNHRNQAKISPMHPRIKTDLEYSWESTSSITKTITTILSLRFRMYLLEKGEIPEREEPIETPAKSSAYRLKIVLLRGCRIYGLLPLLYR